MSNKQEAFVNELISTEFFSLGHIQIQVWKNEMVKGEPEQKLVTVYDKDTRFSLQGASEEQIVKAGFSDVGNNEYFLLYLKEALPVYNADGVWFKVIIDGNEYILRRARPWIAYNSYWISRQAHTLNPY